MVSVVARRQQVERPEAADVRAAASGDAAAFERIVRAVSGHVWRYVVHLIGDPILTEDVVQEVLLRVHRKLRTLRDPERFVPWLLAMARNAAYDAGRTRKRQQLHLVSDDQIPETRTASDPHLRVEIEDALSHLTHELREALVMVGVIGLSYEEVASALGVPEGTVKSRVFRARKQMMEMLDDVV
jgi:RNA polymerase sigma-70 factor (ECF subfamily)